MNLRYAVARLSGNSTNIFRLSSVNTTTVQNNGVIQINLPTNGCLNLRSFALHFNCKINNSSSTVHAGLPQDLSSLISRIELLCAGSPIDQGALQYNTIKRLQNNVFHKLDKRDSDMRVINNSYPPDISAATVPATPTNFCIDEWLGFLGTAEPSFLESGLVGMMSLRIYLADTSVLRLSAAKASGQVLSYELSDIYATMESVSIADGVYDISLAQNIEKQGYLEMVYQSYYSFTDAQTSAANGLASSSRFSVASQSINLLMGTVRSTDDTSGAVVTSYNTGTQEEITKGGPPLGVLKVAPYFNFFSRGCGSLGFIVNNSRYPNYNCSPADWFHIMGVAKNETGGDSNDRGGLTTAASEWTENNFVACARLCHSGDLVPGGNGRRISGFNSMGTSALLNFQSLPAGTGSTPAPVVGSVEVFVVAQCSSSLRIGAGRAIEVIM